MFNLGNFLIELLTLYLQWNKMINIYIKVIIRIIRNAAQCGLSCWSQSVSPRVTQNITIRYISLKGEHRLSDIWLRSANFGNNNKELYIHKIKWIFFSEQSALRMGCVLAICRYLNRRYLLSQIRKYKKT